MNAKIKQTIFYITAFVIIIALSVAILRPFLVALAVAAMLGVILQPVYSSLRRTLHSKNAAALVTVILLIVVIVVPLITIGNEIVVEAQGLYFRLSSGDVTYPDYISLDNLSQHIDKVVRPYVPTFSFDPKQYIEAFSGWVAGRLEVFFSGTLDLVLKFVLALVALFYFLRDGEEFEKHILAFSPLSLTKDKIISDSLKSAIHSVMVGSILVAIIHGLINGIGFAVLGVPNFTLWATAAAIGSFIPFVGPALIWIPATIYLYAYGWSGAWVVLLIWSVFFMFVMNNFIAPLIFNRGMRVHPLLVLFSILGGLQLFGPAGFLIGPLIISLLFVLIKVVELSENSAASLSEHAEK